jgi:hypothetical protein
MGINGLERVMWRLRDAAKVTQNPKRPTIDLLRDAIMKEIGTDPRTYQTNKAALLRLKWLRVSGNKHVIVTDRDIQG